MQIEDINETIGMKYVTPQKVSFSPCGKFIAYLSSEINNRYNELFIYKISDDSHTKIASRQLGITEDDKLSIHTLMQRERERTYSYGINAYTWNNKDSSICFSNEFTIYTFTQSSHESTVLYEHSYPIINYKLSPNGEKIGFTSTDGLWVLSIKDKKIEQLTETFEENITNAISNQLIWEELSRKDSFWWSSDSCSMLIETIDYTDVENINIPINSTETECHYYIFPGGRIPTFMLKQINVDKTVIHQEHINYDGYIYEVKMIKNGFLISFLSRDQRELRTYIYDKGIMTLINIVDDDKWINTNPFTQLSDNNTLIYIKENIDDNSIIFKDITNSSTSKIISGNIQELLYAKNKILIYSENHNNGKDKRIYIKNLVSNEINRICDQDGINNAIVSPCGKNIIIINDSLIKPPTLRLISIKNNNSLLIYPSKGNNEDSITPEEFTFKSRSGKDINGLLYKPMNMTQKHPLLLMVYGGPHVQLVRNSWNLSTDKRAKFYAEKGFFVVKIDNRGTWGKNRAFENEIYLNLGQLEIEDQVAGINYLCEIHKEIDVSNIAVFGWSYGGYMSIRCITHFPHIFKVAVAGAPVVNWELYNAIYTERYMGVPKKLSNQTTSSIVNKKGYKSSSALNNIEKMTGNLLVIHGLRDENVHFNHTKTLVKELLNQNKNINLISIPNERHGLRDLKTATYIETVIYNHIKESLDI
jgi:dipeptidyl-peptidase-4